MGPSSAPCCVGTVASAPSAERLLEMLSFALGKGHASLPTASRTEAQVSVAGLTASTSSKSSLMVSSLFHLVCMP